MAGKTIGSKKAAKFRCALLLELAKMDHARDWTQQFHLGALRNTNQKMLETLWPDTGFDSIGDLTDIQISVDAFL